MRYLYLDANRLLCTTNYDNLLLLTLSSEFFDRMGDIAAKLEAIIQCLQTLIQHCAPDGLKADSFSTSINIAGAKKLQALMGEAGISAEMLADKTKLNLQTINAYVKGSRTPRRKNLEGVAKALNETLKQPIKAEDIFPNIK